MKKSLTEAAILKRLRQLADDAGGQRALARQIGVSESLVSHVLAGRRRAGRALLAACGMRKEVRYVSD